MYTFSIITVSCALFLFFLASITTQILDAGLPKGLNIDHVSKVSVELIGKSVFLICNKNINMVYGII